mgnify:CR=1 FL=1
MTAGCTYSLPGDDKLDRLIAEATMKWGQGVTTTKNGIRAINPGFFAELISQYFPLVFVPSENHFYAFSPETGLWLAKGTRDMKFMVAKVLVEYGKRRDIKAIADKIGAASTGEVVAFLAHLVRDEGFFDPQPSTVYIHSLDGFVVIDRETGMQSLIAPDAGKDFHSRNQVPFRYDPEAVCPRFLNELLEPALSEDDQALLQAYVGQVILQMNLTQTILLITGTAGGGKSSLVNIIEALAGKANVTELRLSNLNSRFETQRYCGKTLLTAKDVAKGALRDRAANRLKALVGKDALTIERKGQNDVGEVVGCFNVIITSNATQPVLLENDREAWERRLLWIRFQNTRPEHPINDFDLYLLERESSGILNWALEGLKHIITSGRMARSQEQIARITGLLASSDSIAEFVRQQVRPSRDPKQTITTTELLIAYTKFCQERDWEPESERAFLAGSAEKIRLIYGIPKRTDVVRKGTNHRGYYGLEIVNQENTKKEI